MGPSVSLLYSIQNYLNLSLSPSPLFAATLSASFGSFLFLFSFFSLLFTLALPMFAPASRFTCRLGSSLRLVVRVEAAAVSFSSDQSARASSPVRVFPCIYFPYRFYVFAINQQQCFSKSQLLSMHCKLCVCCWVNAQHLLYLLCLCIRCVCVWTA